MDTEHQPLSGDLWLPDIRQTPSPNQNERPAGQQVSLLVIHNISLPPGLFGGDAVEAFFQNRLDPAAHPFFAGIADLRVSSHLYIRREGTAQQFVALNQRAWHAGRSYFAGQSDCNDYAIGIELEGSDDVPFEPAQYSSLIRLTQQIRALFPLITPERIVGHSDIAPGRKTDPGPQFAWDDFRSALQHTHPD